MNKKIIALLGPTASGKTKLSIELALHLNSEIISADSRQFYKELNIGVAKPNFDELNQVKHHFINSHSIEDEFSAGEFAKEAKLFCAKYFKKNKNLILVGGSGLYVDALTLGLDNLPKNKEIQQEINKLYQTYGLSYLLKLIEKFDSEALQNVDKKNPRRVIRILEILKITENKMSKLYSSDRNNMNYLVNRFYIDWSRDDLYNRINERVLQMINEGLIEEVRGLIKKKELRSLQTVGYKELFEFFDGNISEKNAILKIQQHTRNYAKRQLTWLRKYKDLNALNPYSNISLLKQMMEILNHQEL